ncbi:hypothetical protein [Zoogloea sp.]|uniref:hypothetical protein n=1 Tax=Zoogloea sp. TaxID=49181 RepID=UPI0014165635|nr:MAG: hypothetical protein F9K15_17305 [Zoogloea sp.]
MSQLSVQEAQSEVIADATSKAPEASVPTGDGVLQSELRAPILTQPASMVQPIPGILTHQIGSGEHAQNSIVYQTIQWSFIGGGLLSAAVLVIAVYQGRGDVLSEVKGVWSIFAPVITLALGYIFGKGK